MSAADIRVDLIRDILSNKISKNDVRKSLTDLENIFGEDAYTDDGFIPKRKPWNRKYYVKLKKLSLAGVSSKNIFCI